MAAGGFGLELLGEAVALKRPGVAPTAHARLR